MPHRIMDQHREIFTGIAMTIGSLSLMDINAFIGSVLGLIGIAYTLRKWYLMEKNKDDQTKPPFRRKK